MNKKIAITGHKGFIGSHLYNKLKDKFDIVGIDLKEGRDVRTLKPEDLKEVDYVFHLAAMAKVPFSVDKPLETHDHNINGTLNVLWCAKETGVKKLIYSASSSAYGKQDELPLKEDMKPNPMSPYAVQKLTGEHYCRVFSDLYGLPTVCLRYFNVYGENMPLIGGYSACLALFLDAAKKGEPLNIFGGEQTRDFTYVGDVAEANILAMESDKAGRGEVINIGGGKNYSIKQIADAISANQKIMKPRKGEPMDTLAGISKAKNLLGWEPKVNLMDWLKSQIKR